MIKGMRSLADQVLKVIKKKNRERSAFPICFITCNL